MTNLEINKGENYGMIREQTLIIYPLYKSLEQVKREIESEAKKRRIENSCIVTINYLRKSVQVTTDSAEFISFLRSNREYSITTLAA